MPRTGAKRAKRRAKAEAKEQEKVRQEAAKADEANKSFATAEFAKLNQMIARMAATTELMIARQAELNRAMHIVR